jgi:hypothetical protein
MTRAAGVNLVSKRHLRHGAVGESDVCDAQRTRRQSVSKPMTHTSPGNTAQRERVLWLAATLAAAMLVGSGAPHAKADGEEMGPCAGTCPNPRPVNFHLFLPSRACLAQTMSGDLLATSDDGVPVLVSYTGSVALGIGGRGDDIPHAAARLKIRGTAGALKTRRFHLSRKQVAAVRAQAREARRRSVIMLVRLRGTANDTEQKVPRDFKFRLRVC